MAVQIENLTKPSVPLRQQVNAFMLWFTDGIEGTIFMSVITMWALFGDDIRLVATHKEDDNIFVVLTIICLVFFTMELCAYSLAYFNAVAFILKTLISIHLCHCHVLA